MSFAVTSGGGLDFGAPDVCLPGPVPYPNSALKASAISPEYTVIFVRGPAHTLATSIPISIGDNPGVLGGVVSHRFMGPSRRLVPYPKLLVRNKPAVRLGATGIQNQINTNGTTIVPSQVKVLLL
ncbi:DUF4150 domain-containing protein [Sorangium sp. So ce590]|uniref:DUF4150 domain-containing protein n=1 Tax=unclassified Sorangium TaxID=2621164 RepID=UPI003F5D9424